MLFKIGNTVTSEPIGLKQTTEALKCSYIASSVLPETNVDCQKTNY